MIDAQELAEYLHSIYMVTAVCYYTRTKQMSSSLLEKVHGDTMMIMAYLAGKGGEDGFTSQWGQSVGIKNVQFAVWEDMYLLDDDEAAVEDAINDLHIAAVANEQDLAIDSRITQLMRIDGGAEYTSSSRAELLDEWGCAVNDMEPILESMKDSWLGGVLWG